MIQLERRIHREKMVENSGKQSCASEDVIIEILMRLPVNSLVRFRCVCKYWHTLTRNSSFITKHLYQHPNSGRLLVQHHDYCSAQYVFSLFLDELLATMPFATRDLHDFQMPGDSGVFGPCNGILGLWDWNHISLWNPCLREFRYLPMPPSLPSHLSAFSHYFGFGLDLDTNDYKVVWIRDFWNDKIDIPHDPRVVAVYTLSTDSWRVFEQSLCEGGTIQDSLCNTYRDGVYYWLTTNNDDRYVILAFDLTNEAFREIPGPSDILNAHWGNLAIYDDFIAMIHFNPIEDEKNFETWLMKEEGIWTKHLTFGPLPDVDRPLGFWKNGGLFLETSTSELVLCDPNTHGMKNLKHRGKDSRLKVFIYKESLVSIKGGY